MDTEIELLRRAGGEEFLLKRGMKIVFVSGDDDHRIINNSIEARGQQGEIESQMMQ